MYIVYGFAHTSPVEVMDGLSAEIRKLEIKTENKKKTKVGKPPSPLILKLLHGRVTSQEAFDEQYGDAKILLVTSMQALAAHKKYIDIARQFILMFDTPIMLGRISNMIPADFTMRNTLGQSTGIPFGYKLYRPNFKALVTEISKKLKTSRNNKELEVTHIAHIPRLISHLETGFTTNIIADFLYSVCSHKEYLPMKNLLFKVMFSGKLTQKNIDKVTKYIGTKGYGFVLFCRLQEELKTDRAKRLMAAAKERINDLSDAPLLDSKPKKSKEKVTRSVKEREKKLASKAPVVEENVPIKTAPLSKYATKHKVDVTELKELLKIYETNGNVGSVFNKDSLSILVG